MSNRALHPTCASCPATRAEPDLAGSHAGSARSTTCGPTGVRSTLGRVACLTALLFGLLGLFAYPAAGATPELSGGKYALPRDGGLYRLLKTEGKQRHHMPAQAILRALGYTEQTIDCGPAIRMIPEDHWATGSYGDFRRKTLDKDGNEITVGDFRKKLRELVEAGKFREAIEWDTGNIKQLFPGRYDAAIAEMLEEYERIKHALEYPGSPGVGGAGCEPLAPGGGGTPEQPAPAPAPTAPAISPAYQEIYGERAKASWTVTVARNAEHEQQLVMDFGDGNTSTVYIPEGTGNMSVPLSNVYYLDSGGWPDLGGGGVWGGVGGGETQWRVAAHIAAVTTATGVVLIPASQPGTATVHQC